MAVICFLASCQDNLKAIEKMEMSSNEPIGEVENMLLKHTDSGKLKLSLQGKNMLDFSNDDFPYTHFPDGIKVTIYETLQDSTAITTILADQATSYDLTDIVDLRGNVRIIRADGNTFAGDQLYWDQSDKWIFTNQAFETRLKDAETQADLGNTSGTVLDSDENLKLVQVRKADDAFLINQDNE